MELIRPFEELSKTDAGTAGGKGASLGEMTHAKIPVPPGFVVLSSSFNRFIQETSLVEEIDSILQKVDHKEIHTVESASEKIKGLIISQEIPYDITEEIKKHFKKLDCKYVAVRSSATAEDGAEHAWAGQLESYLNTTEIDLLDNVKHCWASLFTPRAIFYRFEKSLHTTHISVAVVVQKMVESEFSGIAFSVHPITENYNQLIIEAGYGLGEAIVSGQITPDSYVVEKEPRKILDINVNTQSRALYRKLNGGNEWRDIAEPKASSQVLNGRQIFDLAEVILKVEGHYGFPCDIEWAYEAGKFYIVQSRPITTLNRSKDLADHYPKVLDYKFTSSSKSDLDYSRYQQLFSTHGMSFLTSDTFMQHYKDLGALTTFAHDKWTSFLPKVKLDQTMQDGLKLYGDRKAFKKFKKNINEYYEKSAAFLEKTLSSKNISKDQCQQILEKMSENFVHYSKTEFFYVDEAYRQSEKNNSIKEHLAELEEIKNSSRSKMNKILFQPDSYRKQFMLKICDQFNLTKHELSSYGKKDILALYDGTKLSESIIKDRERSYLMKGQNGQIEYLQGAESEKIIDDFFSQSVKNDHGQLKGITAHKGKAKGPATVIKYGSGMFERLPEVIKNMPQGNVLVSDTTSPELFMACKKASAIITNQGGMMSHAAIVSRELNIPCIVGLGVATDLIKEGDIVEVDADNGIVKILSEKQKIIFSKYMSREHSMFYAHVWNEANRDYFDEYIPGINVKNMAYLRNKNGVLEVYYDMVELENIFVKIEKAIIAKPVILDHIITDFYKYLDKMLPYIQKDKTIESASEMKKFYNSWMRWWSPMAYIFSIPDRGNMSKDLRDKALKVREETQEYAESGDHIYMKYVKDNYPDYLDIATVVTPDEAYRFDSLSKDEILSIKKRLNGCAVLTLNGVSSFVSASDFQRKLKESDIEIEKLAIEENIKEIKGTTACKGFVKGKVKLVLSKAMLANVEKGDIMVSYMTSPDYVPAMKKCAAIVTDEGGIVCHAAIVSRELGLPCIVGTKIATEVLKDNMEVEVNANEGVIKILNKK